MAKILLVENCGECRHVDGITFCIKGYERKCMMIYADERKIDRKLIPDWRVIPDWCPLENR